MNYLISQNNLTDEIKKKIFQGFVREAVKETGMSGFSEELISFEIFNDSELVGVVAVILTWGQLHIKYLFVEEKYRGQGIATQLMQRALEFGKQLGCQFAFLETKNFQAPKFYQKLGFELEFSRRGFANNTALHYLRKALT